MLRRFGTLLGVAGLAAGAVTTAVLMADREPAGATVSRPTVVVRKATSVAPSTLWVDPTNPAAKARTAAIAQGHSATATQLSKISLRPTATWLTGDASSAVSTVKRVTAAANAANRMPVFVLYHLPNRDCGGYSAGGADSTAAYQSWVRSVAGAIGSSWAEVIVEPDAVPMAASRSCSSAVTGRQSALVADAVATMGKLTHTKVYLDAGHSGWVSNVNTLAASLQAAGLANADGFALNTSNFQTLAASLAYGDKLSAATGGRHYVIDTSRNGLGPLPSGSGYAGPSWCNPPGRALGVAPTLQTHHALADAYLWVKYPGASDGSCGLGDPSAGSFWSDYAIGLAQRAA